MDKYIWEKNDGAIRCASRFEGERVRKRERARHRGRQMVRVQEDAGERGHRGYRGVHWKTIPQLAWRGNEFDLPL